MTTDMIAHMCLPPLSHTFLFMFVCLSFNNKNVLSSYGCLVYVFVYFCLFIEFHKETVTAVQVYASFLFAPFCFICMVNCLDLIKFMLL